MLGVNFVIAYQKGVKHKKRLRTVAPKHSTTGFFLFEQIRHVYLQETNV